MEKIIISIVAAVLIGLGTWNLNQTFNLSIEVAKMKTQIEMLTKDLKKIKIRKRKRMTKIWLMLILLSSPNLPSVKYNAYLYKTENECVNAQANFMNYYEKKSDDYKKITVVDTHCIEFESFPIARFNPSGA